MTKWIKNPALADEIFEVSIKSPTAAANIRGHYENGHLIILRDFRFDLDYSFLCDLNFDVNGPEEFMRRLKKFPMHRIQGVTPDTQDPFSRFIFESVFKADAGRLNHFKEQTSSGDRQMHDLYKRIFPGYEDYKTIYSWRFTETMYENLHWDNFGTPDDFHQVRIFTNLDSRPRLWRVSEGLLSFAQRSYVERGLKRYRNETPDRFNFILNNKVLGGMAQACLDQMPKHHLAFEQGEVWLCETRLVSHQIYCGYKAFATMFYVKPESMDHPELRFSERVRRLHLEHMADETGSQQGQNGNQGEPHAALS